MLYFYSGGSSYSRRAGGFLQGSGGFSLQSLSERLAVGEGAGPCLI